MNSPNKDPGEFYGWECISLKLRNRTFDMVITDTEDRIRIVQGLELAMQINNHKWQITYIPDKLTLKISAVSKFI